jgi:hypothetical protein
MQCVALTSIHSSRLVVMHDIRTVFSFEFSASYFNRELSLQDRLALVKLRRWSVTT